MKPYPEWLQIAAASVGKSEWQLNWRLVLFLYSVVEKIQFANRVAPPHVSGAELRSSQVICLAVVTWEQLNPNECPFVGTADKSVFDQRLNDLLE